MWIRTGRNSWHWIRGFDMVKADVVTLCGRRLPASAQRAETFGDDRSCETCLRIDPK